MDKGISYAELCNSWSMDDVIRAIDVMYVDKDIEDILTPEMPKK